MENDSLSRSFEPPGTSFFERMVNVFISPGELYTEVAQSPVRKSSWFIPYMIAVIIALISTYAILSNQVFRNQALEPQYQAMQERVAKGEMTEDQMNAATEMMESSSLVVISGAVMSIVYVSVSLFVGSLLFWFAGKIFMKSTAGYSKILEVYGLTMLIGVVGSIITLLLIFLTGSVLASPGGSLLILDSFDRKNLSHLFLAAMNIMSIWQMIVVGIGIAKCAGKPITTGITISLSLWLVFWVLIPLLIGSAA